jgi:hypothetical protein
MMMWACMALGTCASLRSQQSAKLSKPCLDRWPRMGQNWEAFVLKSTRGSPLYVQVRPLVLVSTISSFG